MINKFQQGRKQQEAIMQFVQGIAQVLQTDPNQVIQIAQQNPDALEAAVQTFQQTQDINQAAQTFQQALQQKAQTAKHGAKLQYIKSLKHQCADDEELYYYKKGGSVGCGCKKKEDGGEVVKAEEGVVAKFKKKLGTILEHEYKTNQGFAKAIQERKEKRKPVTNVPTQDKNPGTTKQPMQEAQERAKHKNNYNNLKKGGEVCPKCGKVHSTGIGCAVAKFKAAKCGTKMKKHQQGGSLNGIPFIKKGLLKKE